MEFHDIRDAIEQMSKSNNSIVEYPNMMAFQVIRFVCPTLLRGSKVALQSENPSSLCISISFNQSIISYADIEQCIEEVINLLQSVGLCQCSSDVFFKTRNGNMIKILVDYFDDRIIPRVISTLDDYDFPSNMVN